MSMDGVVMRALVIKEGNPPAFINLIVPDGDEDTT